MRHVFVFFCILFAAFSQPALAENGATQVTVCVLDSGCNLEGVQGWNYLDNSADISDEEGHGSEVCSLLSLCAPEADIYMLKCFDTELSEDGEAIVEALYAAVDDYHADVINMSWAIREENESLSEAVRYASDSGAVLIASAGNLGLTTGFGSVVYPAAWEEVIGVGGVDLNEDGTVTSSLWYLRGEAVCVCARADGGTERGSSFAAARISGVAASYLAENPDKYADDVRQMLIETAEDLGEEGYDTTYGWGYIETPY